MASPSRETVAADAPHVLVVDDDARLRELLRRYLASRLSILSFMTPLFGVSFGVLILDEPLDAGFVIGAAMVLAGITLVNGAEMVRQLLRRR